MTTVTLFWIHNSTMTDIMDRPKQSWCDTIYKDLSLQACPIYSKLPFFCDLWSKDSTKIFISFDLRQAAAKACWLPDSLVCWCWIQRPSDQCDCWCCCETAAAPRVLDQNSTLSMTAVAWSGFFSNSRGAVTILRTSAVFNLSSVGWKTDIPELGLAFDL